jgi:hypothetical protein
LKKAYEELSGWMAYLKLIPADIRDDLVHIKRIRNHFAHSPRATSLSDSSVRKDFAELSTARDPSYNAQGNDPLTDKRLIYLFAVANFAVFAHNTMQKYPRSIFRTT